MLINATSCVNHEIDNKNRTRIRPETLKVRTRQCCYGYSMRVRQSMHRVRFFTGSDMSGPDLTNGFHSVMETTIVFLAGLFKKCSWLAQNLRLLEKTSILFAIHRCGEPAIIPSKWIEYVNSESCRSIRAFSITSYPISPVGVSLSLSLSADYCN